MPRKDTYHDTVRVGLEKDGWRITADPYRVKVDEVGYEIDFGAEPLIAAELSAFDANLVSTACQAFLKTYNVADDQSAWFDKLKVAATSCGFATDNKDYKANPQSYKGNVADFAKIIRVKLTGKNRTPDLCTIMQVMGLQRVKNRLQ